MAYTVLGDEFKNWVNTVVGQRNAKMTADKDMAIHMDPTIAKLFRASTAVSGKSFVLVGKKKIYLKSLGL